MSEEVEQKPLVIDEITLMCKCGRNRVIYPDTPIVGADKFHEWMSTNVTRCSCDAPTCDVKARLKT